MKKQIKDLLKKFNYPTDENIIQELEKNLNINLPKNHYAIKHYALFIKNNSKNLNFKKGHLIEIISRTLFNEQWNSLSKKIPKDFEIKLNKRYIEYGDIPFDLMHIKKEKLLDEKILLFTTKNNYQHYIISKQSKEVYDFIVANAFSNETEYFSNIFNKKESYFCIGENNNIFSEDIYKKSYKIKNKEKEIKDFFKLLYKEYKDRLDSKNNSKIEINAMDVDFLSLKEWDSFFKNTLKDLLIYGRSRGITIIMATSRATNTERPKDLKFTQKQILKLNIRENDVHLEKDENDLIKGYFKHQGYKYYFNTKAKFHKQNCDPLKRYIESVFKDNNFNAKEFKKYLDTINSKFIQWALI